MEINGLVIDTVPVMEIIEFAKKQVLREYTDAAKLLSTDTKFLVQAALNAPKGDDLNDKVFEYINGVDGIIKIIEYAIRKHNKNVKEEVIVEFFSEILKKEEGEDIAPKLKCVMEAIYGTSELDKKK